MSDRFGKQNTVILASLVVLTLAAFYRVLGNGFVNYDDFTYVSQNEHVMDGLSVKGLIWAFNVGYASNWHPLTWISHMLDCSIFGLNPVGHHAVNLLIHIANVVLLFLVLNRMTRSTIPSAFVAALFAVHPLHVESVAWISERKDVLSTLFWMLTMWAYASYVEHPNARRYLAVIGLYVLGLMSKPMLVSLPVVLLLLDYWPLERLSFGKQGNVMRLIAEKAPLLVLAAGSGALTMLAQRRGEAAASFELLPAGIRISNALVSGATYVLRMFWPSKLAVFYPHPLNGLPSWEIVGSAALLIAISIGVFIVRGRARYLAFGWLWYVVTILPVIGLVQVGAQAWADRYTYVPLIGLSVSVVWVLVGRANWRKDEWEKGRSSRSDSPILPSSRSPILVALTIAVIVVLCALSWIQTGYWKNSFTLFERAIAVTKDNYTALINLGTAHADAKEYDEALPYYDEALKLRPDLPRLYFDYGNSLAAMGRLDEAEGMYSQALSLDPTFKEARYNLDALAAKRERAGQAQRLLQHHAANAFEAHMNQALALEAKGQVREAIEEYKKAIRLNPDVAEAHSNLGVAYKEIGDFDSAIREYKTAIRLNPSLPEAHNNLAIAYYFVRKYADAWKEIHEIRALGAEPSLDLVNALSDKMPDPRP